MDKGICISKRENKSKFAQIKKQGKILIGCIFTIKQKKIQFVIFISQCNRTKGFIKFWLEGETSRSEKCLNSTAALKKLLLV